MSNIGERDLRSVFLAGLPLMDVRAPVEFVLGSLPGAVNLPIMNDAERAAVGTTYKNEGRDAALALGHRLVSGGIKTLRIKQWSEYIRQHPQTVLFCFRGGLRSKITQQWLKESGIDRPLIEGGYKKARQFLREVIEAECKKNFLILSGPTGSSKTQVLNRVQHFRETLDLENLASHRGSAFGAQAKPQPSQINFENAIAKRFLQISESGKINAVVIEDESRLIGRYAIPEPLFAQMRASNLVYIEETFEQRVENIFQDYVVKTALGRGDAEGATERFYSFRHSINMISRKLGGARSQELCRLIDQCEREFLKNPDNLGLNREWIGKILTYYYDPAYAMSLARRNPKIAFRGSARDVLEYLE